MLLKERRPCDIDASGPDVPLKQALVPRPKMNSPGRNGKRPPARRSSSTRRSASDSVKRSCLTPRATSESVRTTFTSLSRPIWTATSSSVKAVAPCASPKQDQSLLHYRAWNTGERPFENANRISCKLTAANTPDTARTFSTPYVPAKYPPSSIEIRAGGVTIAVIDP